MSRARPIGIRSDGEPALWVDTDLNGCRASTKQIEYLAALEDVEIDDLLDEGLTQREAVERLRSILGEGGIPADVEARRQQQRVERSVRPPCRLCGKLEDSTRHHFLPKYLMRELSNYVDWADRRKCTVYVCRDCHDWLHDRKSGEKSIASMRQPDGEPVLDPQHRRMISQMIEQLRRERPVLFDLMANGDRSVYEACLVQDWLLGRFDK